MTKTAYSDAGTYLRLRFGTKIYKASLSLDVTCPNRDGSKGFGGCSFCSADGSGDFSSDRDLPMEERLDEAIRKVSSKAGPDARYIAYFQSFTNTYCKPSYLMSEGLKALSDERVVALSVATRPDCLGDDILDVLKELNGKAPVMVELGLQTADDDIASSFNRCYKTSEYADAVKRLKDAGLEVITHIIFGLPGETREMMIDSVRFAVDSGTDGIKLTCLYVLRGTGLAKMWEDGLYVPLEMEEYFDIVDDALSVIPPHVIVHRLTGDGPKSLLLAPLWTSNKRSVINYINKRFARRSDGR